MEGFDGLMTVVGLVLGSIYVFVTHCMFKMNRSNRFSHPPNLLHIHAYSSIENEIFPYPFGHVTLLLKLYLLHVSSYVQVAKLMR